MICRSCSIATCASLVAVAVLATVALGSPPWSGPIGLGSWRLDSPKGMQRWIVVRILPSDTDSAYHIEVLKKRKGDPASKFTWFAALLAVSESALRNRIRGPSSRAENYPETFDSAYRSWSGSPSKDVCSTSVDRCLK